MKYKFKPTSQFKKDFKLVRRRGLPVSKLEKVVSLLMNGEALPAQYKNHALKGRTYKGMQECHIAPDWLLIYAYNESELYLVATRTGTHSDLFGE